MCLAALLAVPVYAKTISSTLVQVSMLEVYSSQGCSSCPPAEAWMSKFKQDPKLWKQLVPINFHVDYWDYLGWSDPYALSAFGQRQRDYKKQGLTTTVATPGFVVSGEGWNGWFRGRDVPVKKFKAVGVLSVDISGQSASVVFRPTEKQNQKLKLHVAILGFDQLTRVRSGENSGKKLPHDFVVIAYKDVPFEKVLHEYKALLDLPDDTGFASAKKALVFWVSEQANPAPIQVVAGWL